MVRIHLTALLVLAGLLATLGCQHAPRLAANPPADGIDVTVVSYNIRVGHGGARERQPDKTEEYLLAIADWINEIGADVVLLQEVDVNAPRSHRIDQARFLSKKTGMASYYTPALHLDDGWLYGNAVLSRWPIKSFEDVMLFRPDYTGTNPEYPAHYMEQRALQVVELDSPVGPVYVLNTHLGLTPTQRTVQLQEIAAKLDELPGGAAVFFGGDVNARPEAAEITPIRERLADSYRETPRSLAPEDIHTASTFDPRATIDYIFFNPGRISILDVEVPHDVTYSDHFPVVGRYRIHAAED